MHADRRNSSGSLINGLFVLTLCMLTYLGAIGFGTVWMRHRASVIANSNRDLEQQIAQVQRQVNESKAELDSALIDEQLIRQKALFRLNLVQPSEEQVIWVPEDVERRLATKRFARLFSEHEPVATIQSGTEAGARE